MAERFKAAVLKTVDPKGPGVRIPFSFSAKMLASIFLRLFYFMSYYAYILKSEKDNGFYYGHCQNVQQRLLHHNAGKVRSTKSRRPLCSLLFRRILFKI